ncbi:MAG TPA: antibiotic biosynthesis monooxygenase family protein [Dehalococcoidia bacterium]|nr:antibiotic biosynthesis monooxygenase family protein [Dehalococcoidia bacterium]
MAGVRIIVNFQVEGEITDEFLRTWDSRFDDSRGDEGCLQFELLRSVTQPDRFYLIERWQSRELLEKHWEINQERRAKSPPPPGGGPQITAHGLEIYDHRLYHFDGRTLTPMED